MDQMLPSSQDDLQQQTRLNESIAALDLELRGVERQLMAFETMLRSHLMDALIEEQEFTLRYKQQKLLQKAKRLYQKKKGKGMWNQ